MEGGTVSGRRWRGGRRCGGTTTENSIAATKWRMFWESRAGTRTNGVLLGCPSANDGARVPRSHERELAEIGFDIALDWRELRRLLRLLHHRGANGNRHTRCASQFVADRESASGAGAAAVSRPRSTLPPADLFESRGTSPPLPREASHGSRATALRLRRRLAPPGVFLP